MKQLNLTEGVYAIDAEDGDITSNVVLSGDVNFIKVGRYNVTYTITEQMVIQLKKLELYQ